MEYLIEKELEFFLQTYKRLPIIVDYAKGTKIYDIYGNEYLDFLGGIAVNVVGHSHPEVISAIEDQIHRYMHLSNYFYQDVQINYASRFLEVTKYDKLFFTNSGTEANEGALKIVRRWGNQRQKNKVISFAGGFHGRTYGSLSLMDKPQYKELMDPFLDGISIVEYNDIQSFKKVVGFDTAGVFLEFLQGEGGLRKVSQEFVDELWELKSKYNFLVVADEVQSCMFRTGKLFAFEHYNVVPDVVTVAKGFGGGLPLGAILVQSHLKDIFERGMHGTTFGGNPVACAAGLATFNVLYPKMIPQILEVSEYLWKRLTEVQNKFPSKVLEVRGIGLMCGLLLNFEAIRLVEKLLEFKIIANATARNVLRLVPPLVITIEDVDKFILGLENALSKV